MMNREPISCRAVNALTARQESFAARKARVFKSFPNGRGWRVAGFKSRVAGFKEVACFEKVAGFEKTAL